MANTEQLELLKQGAVVWNKWRVDNPGTHIDLENADLHSAKLIGVDLSSKKSSIASLFNADLRWANLGKANLSYTILAFADLSFAVLNEANLKGAQLTPTNLNRANLSKANMSKADLTIANLSEAKLNKADLRNARLGGTVFSNNDLVETVGLEDVDHHGASHLSTGTLLLSKGKIPEAFLRGCGLSDWEIESAKLYNPDLSNHEIDEILYKVHDLRAKQPLQISPLFISYSHADSVFADKLESLLNKKGIRFWRDIHDAKAGKLEEQIDRAIRHNPTVLLILSKNSIKSDWVQHEVRLARDLEKEIERDVLCPVALDDSWKTSPWPERIMEQVKEYNILDFSLWSDDDKFKNMFGKLIDGLNLYYKK